MAKIAIIGAGGFGICLAITANGNGHETIIFDTDENVIASIRQHGENQVKLPGVKIPKEILLTSSPDEILGSDCVIFVVPSRFIRTAAEQLRDYISEDAILVSASKGFEDETFLTLSQVLESVYPNNPVGVLTGPSHAEEVGRGIPTSIVAAAQNDMPSTWLQANLSSETLRIYRSEDPVGCEIGGALKNIIALAAGISDGLGCGDNTKAALMTRGMREITALGVKMGGKAETFYGLSGMGDLIVTCCSMHSRNRRAGILIGQGKPPRDSVAEVGTVEGYYCCHAAYHLAQKQGVSMPITEALYGVLFENGRADEALTSLMTRPHKSEMEA